MTVPTYLSVFSTLSQEELSQIRLALRFLQEINVIGADDTVLVPDLSVAMWRALAAAQVWLQTPHIEHHISLVITDGAADEDLIPYIQQISPNTVIYIVLTADTSMNTMLSWKRFQTTHFVIARLNEHGDFYRLFPTE